MKLPWDWSGLKLARAWERQGYQMERRSGSHLRLGLVSGVGVRHLTIPAHRTLKIGTLAAILGAAAEQLEISRDEVLRRLGEF